MLIISVFYLVDRCTGFLANVQLIVWEAQILYRQNQEPKRKYFNDLFQTVLNEISDAEKFENK